MSESLFDLPGDGAHLNTRIPLSAAATSAPLAVRMRPGSIEEVVGQAHLLGAGSPLRRLVEGTGAASVIFDAQGRPTAGVTYTVGASTITVAADTVEERVLALQSRKRSLAEAALGEAATAATLSRDDLLALLD